MPQVKNIANLVAENFAQVLSTIKKKTTLFTSDNTEL